MICSSSVVIAAKPIRSTVAPATPQKMIRVRCSAGRPATAMPMMMALSPDITRSISTTWMKAEDGFVQASASMSLQPSAERLISRA